MDADIQRLLAEYEQRSAEEGQRSETLSREAFLAARDGMLLAVGHATGQLINILVRESNAKSILEIGTSYGYSALWLAEAARETGGRVVTIDLAESKSRYARDKLASVGLDACVDFRVGDALAVLGGLAGPFDFVLLDLWKELYVPCFELFADKLSHGSIVVADNMLFPEAARAHADAYRERVRASGRFDSVLLPVGSGIELSRLRS